MSNGTWDGHDRRNGHDRRECDAGVSDERRWVAPERRTYLVDESEFDDVIEVPSVGVSPDPGKKKPETG
ncbi:MAG: hypothetical protein LBE81_01085 [Azonexus sp.]|jgi:hypothetical protein|uniref:hypothetical protein n=1 Tax=Azonexus sp. TaxID=1872668 RepID=UPI0028395F0B|nr:hypothetical protein [Azonexus sp.]MDR0775221.1 hypothetical protein [Azonexus sp.]